MTHPVAIVKFVALPLELGSFGLPVVFAWAITPAEMSSLGGVLAILVSALFVGWVNVIAAKAAARSAVKPIAAKLEEIAPVVTEIKAHVNSEKSKMDAEAVAAQQVIALQRETIDELKKATALLAQAKAMADMAQAVSAPTASGTPAPSPVLKDIEQNTKDTAVNTTRAAVVVADVKDAVDQLKDKP